MHLNAEQLDALQSIAIYNNAQRLESKVGRLTRAFESKLTGVKPEEFKPTVCSYIHEVMRESFAYILSTGLVKHRLIDAIQHGVSARLPVASASGDAEGPEKTVQADIASIFNDMREYLDRDDVDPKHPDTASTLADMFMDIAERASSGAMCKEGKPSVKPAEESSGERKHKRSGASKRAAKKAKKAKKDSDVTSKR